MSHFAVLALVGPEDAKSLETLEKKVAELLASYDEGLKVEPYRKEEVPLFATAKKIEWMIGFYNSREKLEETYPTTYEALTGKGAGWSPGVGEDHLRRILRSNIEEMEEIERLLEKHGPPRADDPESLKRWYARDWAPEELGFDEDGTPFALTTYNPRSRWDYYAIGGGWTGVLGGYDPTEDIENWVTCPACGGTGRPDGKLERLDPEYGYDGCTGCEGKGWQVKCPARFRDHEGNVQPVADLLKQIEVFLPGELAEAQKRENEEAPPPLQMEALTVPPIIPFAVLTPDGEWHEELEAGRFGTPDDEPDPDQWMRTVAGILAEHEDCHAVVVDCHI